MKGSTRCPIWARTGFLVAFLLLAMRPSLAHAESPLRVELDPLSPVVHPGRVMPTLWNFQGRGTAVYRGQLQFTLRFEQQKLSTVFIDDVAIAGPEQQLRLMLPPIPAIDYIDQIEVDLQLVADDQTYPLGAHVLRVPSLLQNVSTVAVLESRLSGMRSRAHLTRMTELSLDRFYGHDENQLYTSVFLSTNPQDAAPDPYWWCGFDAVCLFPDGFRELRAAQLESLLPWIKAGGRLYVEANDSTTSQQYAWINELLKAGGQPPLIVDAAGEILSADAFAEESVCLTIGLGKVLIQLSEQTASTPSEIPLHVVGAFWNLPQAEALKTLANADPVARFQAATQQSQPPAAAQLYSQTLNANMEAVIATRGLIEWLLPREIRLVPLSYLSLLLGGLIIVIGPCEWFLLGKIRRRKWTWFTFPTAVLLTTGTTLALSDYYMASTDDRHALLIHDLGADGQLARTYRLELLFPRSSGTYVTEANRAIVAPIRAADEMMNALPHVYQIRAGSRYPQRHQPNSNTAELPHYQGRPPGDYVLTQSLKQWSPQLNGEFSLPDPEKPVQNGPASWRSTATITRSRVEELKAGKISTGMPLGLTQEVQQHFGANAAAAILAPSRGLLVDDNPVWSATAQLADQNQLAYQFGGEDVLPGWLGLIPPSTLHNGPRFWGPGSSGTLRDLPLLAADDPDHWVLLVLVPEGPDWHLYRQVHPFSQGAN